REPYRSRVDNEDGTPPSVAQLQQVLESPQEGEGNYWANWTKDYDYVYVLFTDDDYENPDPARLTSVYTGERFALFKINPPPATPAPTTPTTPAGPAQAV